MLLRRSRKASALVQGPAMIGMHTPDGLVSKGSLAMKLVGELTPNISRKGYVRILTKRGSQRV